VFGALGVARRRGHFVPMLDELTHEGCADRAGSACYEDPH